MYYQYIAIDNIIIGLLTCARLSLPSGMCLKLKTKNHDEFESHKNQLFLLKHHNFNNQLK